MTIKINVLLRKMKSLELELVEEIQTEQLGFINTVNKKRKHSVQLGNKQRFSDYLKKASIKNIISIPFIWAVFIPVLLLDATVSLFQAICFPLYGIPKVKHADYIVFDRQHLKYLNFMEKINCAYCSYFNGAVAYIQEIAARTEQYWCPIKHAKRISTLHGRYQHFIAYGDAKSFRQQKEKVRRNFDDIVKP